MARSHNGNEIFTMEIEHAIGTEYLQWEYNRTHNGNIIFKMGT